ncbi:MAG: hypothetical protein Kow0074_05280 [Candidatus Zixiibacteriota bacterium]
MTLHRNDNGSAMLVVLAVLLMAGLVGIASVNTSDTDVTIAGNYGAKMQSFYVAEAGAEYAFAVLQDSNDWRSGFSEYAYGGGLFNVVVSDSLIDPALGDTIVILSTGWKSEAVSTVELKALPSARNPFKFAAFGDDNARFCGTTSTDSYDSDSGSYLSSRVLDDGNVGSNGHIEICGTADIYGDAGTSSPGDMDITGSAIVHGDTTTTAAPIVLDPIPQADIDYAYLNSYAPAGFSGDYNYNPATRDLEVRPHKTLIMSSGTYYFRDVDLKGEVVIPAGEQVKIYVVGDITVNSQAVVNQSGAPSQMLIFSTGSSMTVNGGAEIRAAVYAPDTDFRLTGGGDFYGSFITNTIFDAGGSSFHYDRSLEDLDLGGGGFDKVAWREL